MIKYDYHIHTNNSHDSEAIMEEYILKAIDMELEELCITDHYEIYSDIIGSKGQTINMEKYYEEFCNMKNKYQDKINLKFGIEIGLRPGLKDHIKELLNKYDFDFIIGSSHRVNKVSVGANAKKFFGDDDVNIGYSKYLEEVYENILMFDEFDVYGHIDYIVRYGDTEDKYLHYEKHKELIDKILKELIKRGKGIEVNTSGFKYGLGFPHPNYEILKKYKEFGGEILTVGSDAHSVKYLYSNFNEIEEKLREIGFKNITSFTKRKAKPISI